MDTIYALASGHGRAGVSVVRISGPESKTITERLCGSLGDARKLVLRDVRDFENALLDRALVVWFPNGQSFTGELSVEIHLHGSIAIVKDMLNVLSLFQDCRLAEPGEFTQRALENGKLDLTQVEGLADLIDAETKSQRVQAMRTLDGALGNKVDGWREKLIHAASLIEVTIDFADEDVPVDVTEEVLGTLTDLEGSFASELDGYMSAQRVREGFEVAILGRPNVGKSTLLNTIAGREAAITSEIAGTTRDVIEVRIDIGGMAVTILDTAGLRDTDDVVENLGIERAKKRAKDADLRIFLAFPDDILDVQIEAEDIVLHPKGDLFPEANEAIVATDENSVSRLMEKLRAVFENQTANAGLVTHERHRIALREGVVHVKEAKKLLSLGTDGYELVAEELRSTIRSMDRLVGRIDVEDLLGEIFSSFCLGK